jgi:hypothetical protein
MVHNGIEYGIMAAYAEGLGIIRAANVGKQDHVVDAETTPLRDPALSVRLDLKDVAEVWRRGSVIASGCWISRPSPCSTTPLSRSLPAASRTRRRTLDDQGRDRRSAACARTDLHSTRDSVPAAKGIADSFFRDAL